MSEAAPGRAPPEAAASGNPDSLVVVLPEGYRIRELTPSDAAGLADAYRRNRQHLAPWEPVRDESFFTEEGQVGAVAGQLAMVRHGQVEAWLLTHGERVVGRVNLNNIMMGVLRSGSLGYWVDAAHLGRGLASAAVDFACAQAQGRGLHRVEAGTLVHNVASQRVLERCGFEFYGVAPRYLFIAGSWQDHRLYQRILHDNPL
jgi:ribosomal-protein-alanine N-acetyltransferase